MQDHLKSNVDVNMLCQSVYMSGSRTDTPLHVLGVPMCILITCVLFGCEHNDKIYWYGCFSVLIQILIIATMMIPRKKKRRNLCKYELVLVHVESVYTWWIFFFLLDGIYMISKKDYYFFLDHILIYWKCEIFCIQQAKTQ